MKKLIAVAASCLLFAAVLQATQQPIYRAVFTAGNPVAWAGGVVYPKGLCAVGTAINTNTTCYMYPGTICNGYMIIDISPPYCGQGIILGMTHAEISFNGGGSWFTIVNTTRAIVMPGGEEAEFDVDSNGVLDGGHVRVNCTDGE